MKWMLTLGKVDTSRLNNMTFKEWSHRHIRRPNVRRIIHALIRLWTYSPDIHLLSAGAVLEQVKRGLRGVLYLDGGWQTIVDGLHAKAGEAGVRIIHDKVTGVETELTREREIRVKAVHSEKGGRHPVSAVILTGAPAECEKLLPEPAKSAFAGQRKPWLPSRAACLDLAVRKLARPEMTFALSLDQPLYYAHHSLAARLSEGGERVVHVMRYHAAGEEVPPRQSEMEMRAFLDRLQPGWEEEMVRRRFLPNMTVTHALCTPHGRCDVKFRNSEGLYVAGDWVGSVGMLADAAMSSAREAANMILQS